MPESNVWKFDHRILLPDIHDSWEPFQESKRYLFDQVRRSNISPLTPNDTKIYFLAAISMCRMMRRCFASVTFSNNEVYAPIIAAELAYQLENWYDHLPTSLSFHRQSPLSIASDDAPITLGPSRILAKLLLPAFCRCNFIKCLVSTYWPAVYSVTDLDVATAPTLSGCSRFFDAYVSLVSSIAPAIRCCSHTPWKFYAR